MTADKKQKSYLHIKRLFAGLLLPVFCLWLAGCGFTPVYGKHGADGTPVAEQLNQIAIDSIPNREGQMMRNKLIDRMYGKGRPAQAVYRLVVKLHSSEEDLGIQADATSTRSLLNMSGDYVLQDMKGKEILHGTAHSVSSFNTLVDEYGNLVAKNAATERTLDEVGEQIVNRLSLYFAEKDEGNTPPKDNPPTPQLDTGPPAGNQAFGQPPADTRLAPAVPQFVPSSTSH